MTIARLENVQKPAAKTAARSSAAKATPGRNGYRYRQQYGVVVICENEQSQQQAFERLKRAGYARLRVVTV